MFKIRRGHLCNELKNNILERDHHKCRKCGETKRLQVHHMNMCNYYEEDHTEKNLITLCVFCHKGLHAKKWKLEDIEVETPEIRYNPMQPEYYKISDEQWSEIMKSKAII